MTAVSRPDGIIGLDFRQGGHRHEEESHETALAKYRVVRQETGSGEPIALRERGMDARAELLTVVLAEGFAGVMEMLEEDRRRLCGPRRLWRTDREAYRHGYVAGQLVLGERKIMVPKPRVRSLPGKELSCRCGSGSLRKIRCGGVFWSRSPWASARAATSEASKKCPRNSPVR